MLIVKVLKHTGKLERLVNESLLVLDHLLKLSIFCCWHLGVQGPVHKCQRLVWKGLRHNSRSLDRNNINASERFETKFQSGVARRLSERCAHARRERGRRHGADGERCRRGREPAVRPLSPCDRVAGSLRGAKDEEIVSRGRLRTFHEVRSLLPKENT